jgi:subtilase family serine protease
MNVGKWGRIALALVLGIGAAGVATAEPVERSGNSFHVAVCARGIGNGEARCFAHVVTDANGNPRAGKAPTAGPGVTPAGYAPADLKAAYNVPNSASTSTIAIVDAYGYSNAESDLATYRTQYGLGACTSASGCFKKLDQSGGTKYPRNNTGWSQETALDLDMASAMCPSCKIVLVEASTASLGNLGAAVVTASRQPGVVAISNSYGGGETGSTSYNASYNHPGIAVTVSSGDSGYGVQFPASSQYVVAVGGTSLTHTASGTRAWTETAWTSAGSGCSTLYPAVQSGYAFCLNNRMEADISAVADPNTGVAVYGPTNGGGSGWQVYGGTSVASPLIAGIYGNKGVGAANGPSKIYASASSLYDVTSGSNGSCGGDSRCTAGPGYDGPTGLGTPTGTGAF